MHLFEKTVERNIIYNGRIFTVAHDKAQLENGAIADREVVLHTGGAGILPIDKDGNVTLVKQFRYGVQSQLVEICAGKLEKGEDPKDCALRELEEELGLKATKVVSLGTLVPTPAYDSEIIHIYLATDVSNTNRHLDDGEFVDIVTMPFEKALEMVYNNTLTDAKTQVALLKAERILSGKD